MRQILPIFALLFALLFAFPVSTEACSCIASGPPCQSFWNTDAIFSGQVTEIADTPVKSKDSAFPFRTRTIRFTVNESFRGMDEKIVEVTTGIGGGDCGFAFQTGQSYLVYAYRTKEDNKLRTGICTRTRLLSQASEDLEYFRGLKNAKSGGMIFGTVMKRHVRKNDEYKPPTPLEHILLTFQRDGNSYEALTDDKGEYRLSNLGAGEYKVRLTVPNNLWGFEDEQTIKVPEKGCAVASFDLETKTFLSGKILNEQSLPAAKIAVNLIPVDQINERHQKDNLFASTDEEGRFIFRSIPSGTYYLGIRLDRLGSTDLPYPRTFYPGTLDIKNAVLVTINEGQVIENYDFAIPKKLTTRKIEGAVFLPDGKPAAKANICIEEVEYSESSMCRDGITTDDSGHFTFDALSNLRYLLRAHINMKNGQRHAEPIEVSADGNVSDIKLVITEPNGTCEKCRTWKRKKN